MKLVKRNAAQNITCMLLNNGECVHACTCDIHKYIHIYIERERERERESEREREIEVMRCGR